jgi:hypothetical protein
MLSEKIINSPEYQKFTKRILDELFDEKVLKSEIARTVNHDKKEI